MHLAMFRQETTPSTRADGSVYGICFYRREDTTVKRTTEIIVFTFLLLFLSACYFPNKENSVYWNRRVDLLILYEYTTPFLTDGQQTFANTEIYPIETDEYGRTLGIMQFDRDRRNPLFGENAIYCILQSGSDNESCFYEDVCCVMAENGKEPAEAIEQLKQINDWNQPLALEKCLKIPFKSYEPAGIYDTDFDFVTYSTAADEATGWSPRGTWLEVLCKDGHGLWMFTMEQNNYDENSPVVLIMMQEELPRDDDAPKLKIMEIRPLENRMSPWEEIHAFKEEMGWQFVNPSQSN